MKIDDLDTPALIVDLDTLEANLKRMASLAEVAAVALRPHIKTHKSIHIAQMQIDAGAVGITCAKLGEAEVMAKSGINNILVAYPIWGKSKIERLLNLHKRVSIHTSLDSLEVAKALSDAFAAQNRRLEILVEVEIGLNRLGIRPGRPLVQFVEMLSRFRGIDFRGLLSHSGHVHKVEDLDEVPLIGKKEGEIMAGAAKELGECGFSVRDVSVGATPTALHAAKVFGVTEIRPGTYSYCDVNTVDIGAATSDQCALRVISTVVGTPDKNRIVIDAGAKALSSDSTRQGGFGMIASQPNARVQKLYEEHGVITIDNTGGRYKIGDRLEIIPNHACMCVNLWDELSLIRKGYVETNLKIEARGKLR